jgi:uncharacterized membrane protein SirB2
MGLTEFYLQIRWVHVGCVIASGSLFAVRSALLLAGAHWANHLALRGLSWAIDTILLTAALMLTDITHQYPFVHAWLTVKLLLLVVYIVVGMLALRSGSSQRLRVISFASALAVFLSIAAVAHWRDPWGPLHLLHR